jgi:putative ABC transport system permease protein
LNRLVLLISGLKFYWKTHLAIVLSCALSTLILGGSLSVGDSVREHVKKVEGQRRGLYKHYVFNEGRFFSEALSKRMQERGVDSTALLHLKASVSAKGGEVFRSDVNVYGGLFEEVAMNAQLASELGLKQGDVFVLRLGKPGILPGDSLLSASPENQVAIRLTVKLLLDGDSFGDFDIHNRPQTQFNVFLPLSLMQEELAIAGQVNMLISETPDEKRLQEVLEDSWSLEDVSLKISDLKDEAELTSSRIFIDSQITDSLRKEFPDFKTYLTYFVSEFSFEDKKTPYSMLTAFDQGALALPGPLVHGEILVNHWLRDDLGVSLGDEISVSYFVQDENLKLVEESRLFKVRASMEMKGLAGDRSLMPAFPGLANAESSKDWSSSLPIDLKRVRDKDEAYWKKYRGTPKAFITLERGQELWKNRYGNATSIRWSKEKTAGVQAFLKSNIKPSSQGLSWRPLGGKENQQNIDFGQLFLGFNSFLIVSAMILNVMIMRYGFEQRRKEVGVMLALGLDRKFVSAQFLKEGLLLCVLGSSLGVVLAPLFCSSVLILLTQLWHETVNATEIIYYFEFKSFLLAGGIGLLLSFVTLLIALRELAREELSLLLGGLTQSLISGRKTSVLPAKILWLCTLALLIASFVLKQHAVLLFFVTSFTCLLACLAALRCTLKLQGFGRVALLAFSTFLLIAVGAHRIDSLADAFERDSGTGGFLLFAKSSTAISRDLNSSDEREKWGLDNSMMKEASVVALRLREGEDASCLNLNKPQSISLLGVSPHEFEKRGAFSIIETLDDAAPSWSLLNTGAEEEVTGLADASTIKWILGKSLGDRIEYKDEKGETFTVRLVAGTANSLLQGHILISKKNFEKRFPSLSGFRVFLWDAPASSEALLSQQLSNTFQDQGYEVEAAHERLAKFNAIENTHLSIFATLGALGLILGCLGFGLLVTRELMQRRSELALMLALGFGKWALQKRIFKEQFRVLFWALATGVLAALISVLPSLLGGSRVVPYVSISLLILALFVSGALWIYLATYLALRGNLLTALRNE